MMAWIVDVLFYVFVLVVLVATYVKGYCDGARS